MSDVPVTQSVPVSPEELGAEFEQLVADSVKLLFGKAYWLCRHRHLAEDLVQETYLRLWVAWRDRPGSITAPRAYASKILVNVYADYCKKLRRGADTEAPEAFAEVSDELAEQLENIRCAVAELPPQQRELIYLHYYEGLSLAEAADAMQIAAKTAHNYHTLAKNRLRTLCSRNSVTAALHGDEGEKESL